MAWPRLESLDLGYQPMTIDELKGLVRKHRKTVRDIQFQCPWFLRGRIHDILETIRGFESLAEVDITFPTGSDFSATDDSDFKRAKDDITTYLLKRIDAYSLRDGLLNGRE